MERTRQTTRIVCLALFLSLFLCSSSWAWRAKVIELEDGDSGKALKGWTTVEFRLYGIDAPEFDQEGGKQAKSFTSHMLLWKQIEFKTIDRDQYGREVCLAYREGKCVNEELVKSGFAWVYQAYCKESCCSKWIILEKLARGERKGLWKQPNPTPPWEYRYQKRSTHSPGLMDDVNGLVSRSEYHGNVSSKVFHSSKCKHFNCKNCTARFATRDEAIKAGFKPCSICKP